MKTTPATLDRARRARAGTIGLLESCRCAYPLVRAETSTEHALDCPAHGIELSQRAVLEGSELAALRDALAIKQADLEVAKGQTRRLEAQLAEVRKGFESGAATRMRAEDERDAYRAMLADLVAAKGRTDFGGSLAPETIWKRARVLLKDGPTFADEKPYAIDHDTTCIACVDPVRVGDRVTLWEEGYRHETCPRDRKAAP